MRFLLLIAFLSSGLTVKSASNSFAIWLPFEAASDGTVATNTLNAATITNISGVLTWTYTTTNNEEFAFSTKTIYNLPSYWSNDVVMADYGTRSLAVSYVYEKDSEIQFKFDAVPEITIGFAINNNLTNSLPYYTLYDLLYLIGQDPGNSVSVNYDAGLNAYYAHGASNSVVWNGTKTGTNAVGHTNWITCKVTRTNFVLRTYDLNTHELLSESDHDRSDSSINALRILSKENNWANSDRTNYIDNVLLVMNADAFPLLPWELTPSGPTNSPGLSSDEVQAALDAASDGDTITLPAGTATWTNTVSVTNKAIWIKGAGAGLTVITNLQAVGTDNDEGAGLVIYCTTNGMFKMSGITFDGGAQSRLVYIAGDLWSQFQVYDCDFRNSGSRALATEQLMCGLIYRCNFLNCNTTIDIYALYDGSYNYSWTIPLTLGTIYSVVVEDCSFTYTANNGAVVGVSSSGHGGRSAWRFNSITNNDPAVTYFRVWDAHGNQNVISGQTDTEPPGGTGVHRGTRQAERYQNTVVNLTGERVLWSDFRGGTLVVWSNTATGSGVELTWRLREEDCPGGNHAEGEYPTNYPGWDRHNAWIWGNTVNGSNSASVVYGYPDTDPNYIIEGTNLFWTAKAGYTPLRYPHPWRDARQRRAVVRMRTE